MSLRLLLCAALVCVGLGSASAAEPEKAEPAKFELKDGDRVVFLGNTLIEREQKYGYWELMLTMAWPERNVTFRNLGWSGDTVWGESRAGFGTQADGFKKLVEEVNAAKPTVIFVGYGNVEAFEGEMGLPKFVEGFGKLLDVLEATKARIVILGPTYQIVQSSPSANVDAYNRSVELYSAAMAKVAAERSHRFVDVVRTSASWLARDVKIRNTGNFTTTGLDLTEVGYSVFMTEALMPGLDYRPAAGWDEFTSATAKDTSALRHAIQKKNELFFHRWRPQNETYLFGFRKHEQGKNAVEVFQFDPLVEAEEKKIAELRVKLAAEMKNGGAK